jgi:hypothetical protein
VVIDTVGGDTLSRSVGVLRVNIDKTHPLDKVAEAQQHNIGGHTRGKVVVDMGAAKGSHK